jgi:hypothetical protein
VLAPAISRNVAKSAQVAQANRNNILTGHHLFIYSRMAYYISNNIF